MKGMVRACKSCGKLQIPDKSSSNERWTAYKPNATCDCGGTFGFMLAEDQQKLIKQSGVTDKKDRYVEIGWKGLQ